MSRSVARRVPSLVFGLIFALASREGGAQRTPRLVVDLEPGSGSSSPTELAVAAGRVWFSACLPATGCEPWSSDGTAAGTTPLGDLGPGAEGSAPRSFVGVGAQVFFLANDGTTGHELWVSDGTAAGTHLVEEIRPGVAGAQISEMVAFEGRLWFDADDGTNGTELWSSDGTAEGTALAANLVPGGASSSPGDFTVAGRRCETSFERSRLSVRRRRSKPCSSLVRRGSGSPHSSMRRCDKPLSSRDERCSPSASVSRTTRARLVPLCSTPSRACFAPRSSAPRNGLKNCGVASNAPSE